MSNNIYNSRILIFISSQAVQDMFEKDMQQAILESKMAFEQQQQHQVCFKELTWLLAAWSKVNTFVRSGMILRCAHCCVDRGVVRNIISPIVLIGLRDTWQYCLTSCLLSKFFFYGKCRMRGQLTLGGCLPISFSASLCCSQTMHMPFQFASFLCV